VATTLCGLLPALIVSVVVLCAQSSLSAQNQRSAATDTAATSSTINIPDFNKGRGGQFTYNLSHWAGLAFDASGKRASLEYGRDRG
jgi:hypothetical protein